MKPFVMQARQQAYEEILGWGLLAIREAARAGKAKVCENGADPIHNLPSLLLEANEARHHCYIVPERKYYIASLDEHGDAEYAEQQLRQYKDPWKVLMTLALDELDPTRGDRRRDERRRSWPRGGVLTCRSSVARAPPRLTRQRAPLRYARCRVSNKLLLHSTWTKRWGQVSDVTPFARLSSKRA